MSDLATYLLLFVAGAAAGTINVLAGGGSFISLPLLIFLGLPPTVANGTNRIAILLQNAGAVWSFNRHGVMDWSWIRRAAVPALAGAGLGTWAAIRIGDASFQRILATLMVVFAVVILLDPLRNRIQRVAGAVVDPAPGGAAQSRVSGVAFSILFFGVGVYGGFVQAGVGFFILAVAMLAGLDLVKGNALKVLVVLVFTPLALVLFSFAGKVDWGMGTALAGGNLLGGLAGTHLTVLKGHAWVKRVVVVMIVVFALKLWIAP
ncbi:MAG: sulfite exporter TauE/SafE family protein [Gemmatimonadetes bacterium]|nr:sulfite exporter TauE/SafE family protein [Gemmatimonadota bacterium]